jgi:hypothetical protein
LFPFVPFTRPVVGWHFFAGEKGVTFGQGFKAFFFGRLGWDSLTVILSINSLQLSVSQSIAQKHVNKFKQTQYEIFSLTYLSDYI